MKKSTIGALIALTCMSANSSADAHAPVLIRFSLPVHHAALNPLMPLHFSGASRAMSKVTFLPQSGSNRAFNQTLKAITGLSVKNTILNAPLQNVSGQLATVNYFSFSSGYPNRFEAYPAINYFGSNPLNSGSANPLINVSNLNNVFVTGLKPLSSPFPFFTANRVLSGALRAKLNLYNAAATNGYNGGLAALQHPTGGVIAGTSYFSFGAQPASSFPEFFAFGNSPYAQNALAMQGFNSGVSLNAPPASYLQFGKIIRPINNGILSGTDYFPTSYGPPYLPYATTYRNQDFFILVAGASKLNTAIYGSYLNTTSYLTTFFK